ncbi:hypothetical protein ASC97_07500 [Rhizobium sp. Root1203]|uniref:PDC sensor domain-containing protein n=1 Tax=Rhizobium sp. Root1203 TaxID=1736427 RepID=UPI000709051A|nr:PDC sensor domain-containing protein [Rhizobium sp. Root1203]KQV28177.1 hypothetical protein ASC97_07500 [Rhizobium sp. Root1203]
MVCWRFVGIVATLGFGAQLYPCSVSAEPAYVSIVREYVEKRIKPIFSEPIVRNAITAQNGRLGDVSEMDIRVLDNTYRSEIQTGKLQMAVQLLSNPVSLYLKSKQDQSQGTIVEMFVTDRRGLNVAQSTITTDYWQGDEDKFLKTIAKGSDDIFIDRAERDDVTQLLQTQASFMIRGEDGTPIGIATVTIAIDAL